MLGRITLRLTVNLSGTRYWESLYPDGYLAEITVHTSGAYG